LTKLVRAVPTVPGAIQKAFVTREHNGRGKYRIRLYDAKSGTL
jgi:hypothetical protein